MSSQKILLVCMSISALIGCSENSNEIALQSSVAQTENRAIVKKKVQPTRLPYHAIAPELGIDYGSSYSNTKLPKPVSESENTSIESIGYKKPSKVFHWEADLHNKPLSLLRSTHDISDDINPKSLVDLVAYTSDEISVIESAFPDSVTTTKLESIYDGDTVLLSKINTKSDTDLKFKENGTLKIKLMNIDCPELEQNGGMQAKRKLTELLAVRKHINTEKPVIKLRYRASIKQDEPLMLMTLSFNNQEFSINRSLVYSGYCFAYTQYNQDQLLVSIQQYAQYHKKGIWSQQVRLMAAKEWMMPWDYRAHIAAK